jgi:hypothetical protein
MANKDELIKMIAIARQDEEANAEDIAYLESELAKVESSQTREPTLKEKIIEMGALRKKAQGMGSQEDVTYLSNQIDNAIDQISNIPDPEGVNSNIPNEIFNRSRAGKRALEADLLRQQNEYQQNKINEENAIDKALGVADLAVSSARTAGADIVGGLAGASQPLVTALAGSNDPTGDAVRRLRSIQNTFGGPPITDTGKRYAENITRALSPVVDQVTENMQTMGDSVFEKTGNPIAATMAYTAIPAFMEILGIKGMRAKKDAQTNDMTTPENAIKLAQPSPVELKQKSKALYKEIEQSGVEVPREDFLELRQLLFDKAISQGMSESLSSRHELTPKARSFISEVEFQARKPTQPIQKMNDLRKQAKNIANDQDKAESSLGSMFVREIDNYLDGKGLIEAMKHGPDIGTKYRQARNYDRRKFKYDDLEEIFDVAFEKGAMERNDMFGQPLPDKPRASYIRDEFENILTNKDRKRGFSASELRAMRRVTQGKRIDRILRSIGVFAPVQDVVQAHTAALGAHIGQAMLMGSIGGPLAGATGLAGMATVPILGQFSHNMAKKLMVDNAEFAKALVKGGMDAENVVKQYFKFVPKSSRNASDLKELLLKTDLNNEDWAKIKKYSRRHHFVDEAYFQAAKTYNEAMAKAAPIIPLMFIERENENQQAFKNPMPQVPQTQAQGFNNPMAQQSMGQ